MFFRLFSWQSDCVPTPSSTGSITILWNIENKKEIMINSRKQEFRITNFNIVSEILKHKKIRSLKQWKSDHMIEDSYFVNYVGKKTTRAKVQFIKGRTHKFLKTALPRISGWYEKTYENALTNVNNGNVAKRGIWTQETEELETLYMLLL